jgi:hypothetical protein
MLARETRRMEGTWPDALGNTGHTSGYELIHATCVHMCENTAHTNGTGSPQTLRTWLATTMHTWLATTMHTWLAAKRAHLRHANHDIFAIFVHFQSEVCRHFKARAHATVEQHTPQVAVRVGNDSRTSCVYV